MEENVNVQSARDSARTATSVSVVVPCRNEKRHIEETLKSITAQQRPDGGFEVIVVDGMSDDGTREILLRFSQADPRVKVVDNPARSTPSALNTGIRASRGSIIVIMGAHAWYAPDYIVTCLRLLEEHAEADCVGGPIKSRGTTTFGRAVAMAMSHPLGVGNARHRFPDYEGYAEGACFPMFRRGVFEKVGLYDEALVRNQDDEFNFRLTKSGGRIFISPLASSAYIVRESPTALFRQYFQYGLWRVAVLRNHQRPSSLRQIVPAIGLVVALSLGAMGVAFGKMWTVLAWVLPVVYLLLFAGGAVLGWLRAGFAVAVLFPVAAAIMHVAYAVGFLAGIGRVLFSREVKSRIPLLGET